MKVLYQHPVITSFMLTPILLAIAAISGGVGHGSYTLAIVLFPFAALSAVMLDHFFNSTILMIFIASAQFPLYGTVLSISQRKSRGRIVLAALLALHTVAAALALLLVYY